ncbi:MAG: MgtC/SapB family protein [Thermoanaerobaculia bacterium]
MDAELVRSLETLALALGLGMLVGLQRESVNSRIAGLRTFGLVTVTGALAGLMAPTLGPWLPVAAVVAIASFAILGNLLEARTGSVDPGTTTEVAMVLMCLIGIYLATGARVAAVVLSAAIAVLLQLKDRARHVVERLGEKDIEQIIRFALISLVILPVLPNRNFGPFDVLNLYNTWLMVVLIVGLSLGGYIAYKFFGTGAGVILGGILGGAVSSTATTVSYSRRSKEQPESSGLAATVILIASTIVWIRVIVEIGVVAPGFLPWAIGPFGMMLALTALISCFAFFRQRGTAPDLPEQDNPSDMKSALLFAFLYAVVLLAAAWAQQAWGNRGLFAVALIAGLTDVDAITLSTAQLVSDGRLGGDEGWRIVLTAVLSNTLFKLGAVAVMGSRRLLGLVAAASAIVIAVGVATILVWP